MPPTSDPPDAQERAPLAKRAAPDAPRWAGLAGALGGLLLVAAPFLPWVHVEAGEAERFGRALAEAAAAEERGEGADGLADLGRRLQRDHALTGFDVVQWSRAARSRLSDPAQADAPPPARRTRLARAWTLVPLLVLGLAGMGALLAGTLVAHRLRRYRAPLQALTGVASALAGGLGAAWAWVFRPLSQVVTMGRGHEALLAGGALLLAALVGAVRWSGLALVAFAILLTLLAVGALGWAWLSLPT